MAVVVVSSDLEEVIGLANQVLVLARGIQQGAASFCTGIDLAVDGGFVCW
jgi:ABC-type sugar transport system ATPase subunit